MLVAVGVGAAMSVVSEVLLARLTGADAAVVRALAPKSATTPIALGIAEKVGAAAEHPTLDHDLHPNPEQPSLDEARRLLAAAQRFRRTVTRYKNAVIDSLVPLSDHDVDPF